MPKIRILVVDDSVLVRRMVSNVLSEDPELEVVGVAANGRIALAKIPQVNPHLIVLDVEMPEMDGLETLGAIRRNYPKMPVIMFSALTERGASITLDAIALGATDYVTKPANTSSKEAALQYLRQQLIGKIKVFCTRGGDRPRTRVRPPLSKVPARGPAKVLERVEIVAIGVSTGGPNALASLLPALPANFPVPVVIVQHMPPLFTKRLAQRLSQTCQLQVAEGFDGAEIRAGQVWLAPGDFHMVVEREGKNVRIRTHKRPPENSCRPAVDVLFRSLGNSYGAGTLAVVLTGMGQDGLAGCQCIREAGGQILVQDEASSVVWGMPGMVANAGLADRVLPLHQISSEIIKRSGK
ncbi:MAG: chemotaxis response regulator protein-glutamate methylesterase [Hormoscilla sp.]